MKITAIYGSPRKDGNSDLLLKSFVRGAKDQGVECREIVLRKMDIGPCIECGACNSTGKCVLKDDMPQVYPYLIQADAVVLSAPIFFYAMNALAKAMVDRTQCLWVRKYLLNIKLSKQRGHPGKGILLSVGGSRGKKTFDSMHLTMKYFFDALDMDYSHHLVYGGIDEKGTIAEHADALDEAFALGKEIADNGAE